MIFMFFIFFNYIIRFIEIITRVDQQQKWKS